MVGVQQCECGRAEVWKQASIMWVPDTPIPHRGRGQRQRQGFDYLDIFIA